MSSNLVVVFSKSADADNVKTRMRPMLTPENCLSFHLSLLKDTLDKVYGFSTVLYLAGSGHLPFDPGVPIRLQTGADLGARMKNAFQQEFEENSKIVIIGTDSPTFPSVEISNAFAALNHNDIVLGPCEDGGYYLIGLRKLIPEMFFDVPWGTPEVLRKTLEIISGYSYRLLDPYFDVDLPQDLMKLKEELEKQDHVYLKNVKQWLTDYFGNSAR